MINNTQKKFAWTTLADAAPEYELYLRRKEAAMASNKISYIDEQDQSELIMATKCPPPVTKPITPVLAGAPAIIRELRETHKYELDLYHHGVKDRNQWQAEHNKFFTSAAQALALYDDLFEIKSTIGVFIDNHRKATQLAYTLAKTAWIAGFNAHANTPAPLAAQLLSRIPLRPYWEDQGAQTLLPVPLQFTYDVYTAADRARHPYTVYCAVTAKITELFATGKASQRHYYEKLWHANVDSNQTPELFLQNEEIYIGLINQASDAPMDEVTKEDKLIKSVTGSLLKLQVDRLVNDKLDNEGARLMTWQKCIDACKKVLPYYADLEPEINMRSHRANFSSVPSYGVPTSRAERRHCPRCFSFTHQTLDKCTSTSCYKCHLSIPRKPDGRWTYHNSEKCDPPGQQATEEVRHVRFKDEAKKFENSAPRFKKSYDSNKRGSNSDRAPYRPSGGGSYHSTGGEMETTRAGGPARIVQSHYGSTAINDRGKKRDYEGNAKDPEIRGSTARAGRRA
jgi:hypothetical protein